MAATRRPTLRKAPDADVHPAEPRVAKPVRRTGGAAAAERSGRRAAGAARAPRPEHKSAG